MSKNRRADLKGYCLKCGAAGSYTELGQSLQPHNDQDGNSCSGFGKFIIYGTSETRLHKISIPVTALEIGNTPSPLPALRFRNQDIHCPQCGSSVSLDLGNSIAKIPPHRTPGSDQCALSEAMITKGAARISKKNVLNNRRALPKKRRKSGSAHLYIDGTSFEVSSSIRTVNGGIPGSNRRKF